MIRSFPGGYPHLEGAHVLHGADVVQLDGLVARAGDEPVAVFVPRDLIEDAAHTHRRQRTQTRKARLGQKNYLIP